MREIKFRAWDSQFNNWVNPDDMRMNCATGEVHGKFSCGNVPTWKLEQFTGLTDKNGKEIFDGDIVLCNPDKIWPWHEASRIDDSRRVFPSQYSSIGGFELVEYLDDMTLNPFHFSNPIDDDCEDKPEYFQIIGNIHENPEFETLGYIYGFEPQKKIITNKPQPPSQPATITTLDRSDYY